MPNFKSISFKMAVLQGGVGRICPPHVCVIQKTPCGIGLKKAKPCDLVSYFEMILRHRSLIIIVSIRYG